MCLPSIQASVHLAATVHSPARGGGKLIWTAVRRFVLPTTACSRPSPTQQYDPYLLLASSEDGVKVLWPAQQCIMMAATRATDTHTKAPLILLPGSTRTTIQPGPALFGARAQQQTTIEFVVWPRSALRPAWTPEIDDRSLARAERQHY